MPDRRPGRSDLRGSSERDRVGRPVGCQERDRQRLAGPRRDPGRARPAPAGGLQAPCRGGGVVGDRRRGRRVVGPRRRGDRRVGPDPDAAQQAGDHVGTIDGGQEGAAAPGLGERSPGRAQVERDRGERGAGVPDRLRPRRGSGEGRGGGRRQVAGRADVASGAAPSRAPRACRRNAAPGATRRGVRAAGSPSVGPRQRSGRATDGREDRLEDRAFRTSGSTRANDPFPMG